MRPALVLRVGVLILVGALVAGVTGIVVSRTAQVHVTAYYKRTVGLYEGADVRVLGVQVGKVTDVQPEGDRVRVEFEYPNDRKVPADAKALVVAPTVVSDRYIQLAPVYDGGPVLQDGAKIPLSRTAVPVELDDIYRNVDNLSKALGPSGANRNGSLSRLLKVGAANLGGNGDNVKVTIKEASKALKTLNDGSDDLFGTVRNLAKFTSALKKSDAAVVAFNRDLAGVSKQLDNEKEELGAALKNLAVALAKVSEFVKDNKKSLNKNVKGLAEVTGVLVKQKKALASFLQDAPVALSNLQLSFNPDYGTLDNRNNFRQFNDPTMYLCSLLISLHAPKKQCNLVRQAYHQVVKKLPVRQTLAVDPTQDTASEPVGAPDPTLAGILGKNP